MSAPAFTRCVVIVNQRGTHYQRGMKFVDQLRQVFSADKIVVVKLSRQDYDDPSQLVATFNETLDSNTLLGVAAGDGSTSYIANLLLSNPGLRPKTKRAVLLPLWGGNANDLAYMANGLSFGKNIKTILSEGTIVTIYPLDVSIRSGRTTIRQFALNYASFGASAFAAHKLNQPKHRNKRLYHLPGARTFLEASSVTKALVDAKRFQCEIDGVKQTLYDLMFVNGSRIAKVDRAPIQLTDPYFYEIRTTHKRPVVIGYAASLLRNITQRRPPVAKRTLTAHDPTWVQMDGEVQQVPAPAEISVTRSEQGLRLLSTKLSESAATDG